MLTIDLSHPEKCLSVLLDIDVHSSTLHLKLHHAPARAIDAFGHDEGHCLVNAASFCQANILQWDTAIGLSQANALCSWLPQMGFTGTQAKAIMNNPEPLLKAAGVTDECQRGKYSKALAAFVSFKHLFDAACQCMDDPSDPAQREAKVQQLEPLVAAYQDAFCLALTREKMTFYNHFFRWEPNLWNRSCYG